MCDPESADAFVRGGLHHALSELDEQGLEGPDIRERKHFDPAMKRALGGLRGEPAAGKLLTTEHFPGVGAVDVMVPKPPALLELKWSYDEIRSKIFESLWDAVKLALLGAKHHRCGYLVTGASIKAWEESECADLFEKELVCPREMWDRPLVPAGPNGGATVGEDLIRGSRSGSRPLAAPERLSITRIDWISVRGNYQVGAVRVAGDGPIRPW